MKVEKARISELRNPERNVRKHNQKQIAEFARSLEKFGQIRPVVIDENSVVYCGNGLVEAAKSLGWEKVEVLRKTGMSESDKKKLMIADNKIYTLGFDDYGAINEMLEEIGDFDIPGFDTETLEAMFGDVDDEIESFGILEEEEKRELESEQSNAPQRPTAYSVPENAETESESESEEVAEEPKGIVCPNCGHVFG